MERPRRFRVLLRQCLGLRIRCCEKSTGDWNKMLPSQIHIMFRFGGILRIYWGKISKAFEPRRVSLYFQLMFLNWLSWAKPLSEMRLTKEETNQHRHRLDLSLSTFCLVFLNYFHHLFTEFTRIKQRELLSIGMKKKETGPHKWKIPSAALKIVYF